eukprot:GHVR01117320.1.p1 GENE.GHVR01117320.1~~GHVR01117320.1.p1  ORF type:complete len:106 (+),score=2.19 GHVR01117320.1:1708-2025(+)
MRLKSTWADQKSHKLSEGLISTNQKSIYEESIGSPLKRIRRDTNPICFKFKWKMLEDLPYEKTTQKIDLNCKVRPKKRKGNGIKEVCLRKSSANEFYITIYNNIV